MTQQGMLSSMMGMALYVYPHYPAHHFRSSKYRYSTTFAILHPSASISPDIPRPPEPGILCLQNSLDIAMSKIVSGVRTPWYTGCYPICRRQGTHHGANHVSINLSTVTQDSVF